MLDFHIYDVFTDTPFSGNPLAIVEGADGLSDAQMQTMARQFNLSETIFVQTPVDPSHTAKVRIFTPSAEIPFAGHPTIGCALHLADGASRVTLEEVAGLVPVDITKGTAEFTAPRLPKAIGTAPSRAHFAAALDLPEEAFGPDAPGAFEGGPAFLYAQISDLDTLARARTIEPGYSALMQAADIDDTGRSAVGIYLYTAGRTSDFQSRMFSASDGVGEDPATGSATAIFAAQLNANGHLPSDGTSAFDLRQGVEMGRPSALRLTIETADGHPTAIRVAGQAVKVAHGQIKAP